MAAQQNKTFADIRRDIAARRLAPVYLLHGEECYFIDELAKDFESVIPESERDFNMYQFYAPQISMDTVASTCQRYPVMSQYQMVILKEAQAVSARELNKLIPYIQHAIPSTIFVIISRGEKSKSATLVTAVKKAGVVFESVKLRESGIDALIASIVKERGLNIESKSAAMLRDFIGNDVARIYNELNKLTMILGKDATITPESIELNVGISKDYNNFELVDSIAVRNMHKSFEIVEYFRRDPKRNPAIVTGTALYTFFSNLMIAHFTRDKSPRSLMDALGFRWESQLKNISAAMRSFNARQTIEILSAIRSFDVKSKGIGSRMNEYDLLLELLIKVYSARGVINS
ncbi:MAG: DNA polymerase III subunit delta [Muribaculaceae bacterium]|nr:DNA polymerase III subunit delta [Muribaculaceae bacterium]